MRDWTSSDYYGRSLSEPSRVGEHRLSELLIAHRNMNDIFQRTDRTGMPTLPPPPTPRLKDDLHSRAAELRRMGAQLLARANELDQIAERL